MLQRNNIANLLKGFLCGFFTEGYPEKVVILYLLGMIYRKFLDIILYKLDIQKVSQIYPLQGRYPEIFCIINS